jgi:hypothetical protein
MKNRENKPGTVAHTYKPATQKVEIGRIMVRGQPQQKCKETQSQQKSLMYMLIF